MNTTKKLAPAAFLFLAVTAHAQIATDGSVGARTTFSGRSVVIPDSLGLRMGTNLLHSFSTFNVPAGDRATFAGVGFVQNIIARITGGTASRIDGTIASAIPGSNLFLVNPSGLVFGPTAAIDVPGSFHASTAHYLKLADGTRIAMSATPDVTLTFAAPAAFGFEGAAAPIALQGAQLRVSEGRRISIAGGDVTLDAASGRASALTALSGTVGIAAVQSAGEAIIDASGLRSEGFGAMGALAVRGGSVVNVSEGPGRTGGGAISLAGGNVTLDHATIASRTAFGGGRGIDIRATDALAIDASNVLSITTGGGNAGALALRARDVTISGASLVDTSCDPGCTTGIGGPLTLRAAGTLRIEGTHPVDPTYVVSNSFGAGRTGAIEVTAGRLEIDGNAFLQGIATASGDSSIITVRAGDIVLRNGGQIDGGVQGRGQGGRVDVAATGGIRIEGVRPNLNPNPAPGEPPSFPSGIFSNTVRDGIAGDVVISTRTLDITGGGEVSSSAGRLGVGSTGRGGSITINASERVTVRGFANSPAIDASGIFANTFGAGDGGSIALAAPLVQVLDDGKVQAQSEGGGRSGAIRITGGDLTVSSRGQVASSSGLNSGDGGTITIALDGTLTVAGARSGIFAVTTGPGAGGNIEITARRARLEDLGSVSAQTSFAAANAGRGGTIALRVSESLSMTGGAVVRAETFSTGNSGALDIRSGGRIDLSGGARITTTATGTGDAGTIRVEARDAIAMSGGASVTSESESAGLAARIDVVSGGLLTLASGARISTAARSSDGGDIAISAVSAFLDGSRITTEVGTGQGGGGNMEIQVPTLVMRNALITANAFGGPGGNIHIATTTFIPSADSRVTASSQLGVDGTITLDSPVIDPTGALLIPPPGFLDAGAVLAGRCGPRLAGRASSLVITPRAGLGEAPDAWRLTAAATAVPWTWAQPLACIAAAATA